jgi:hypothetical protein
LERGESGVVGSLGIVTIVVDAGVNELAAIRSDVSLAETTSSSLNSASSGRSSTEFREVRVGSRASLGEETASLSLTEPVTISVFVVGGVPTRTFEHGKGELTVRLLIDQTRSHGFEGEESSFEMGTGGGGTSTVFKVSTLQSGASEEASDSAGKGRNVDNLGLLSTDGSRLDVARELLAAGAQEVIVETGRETENVGSFVQDHVDILFV